MRAIAGTLNARGIPTARGGTWSAMQVSNVLQRAQPKDLNWWCAATIIRVSRETCVRLPERRSVDLGATFPRLVVTPTTPLSAAARHYVSTNGGWRTYLRATFLRLVLTPTTPLSAAARYYVSTTCPHRRSRR